MKRSYYILIFLILVLGVVSFSFFHKKGVQTITEKKINLCSFDTVILPDLPKDSCEYQLIGYTNPNVLTKIGPKLLSGAKWISSQKIDFLMQQENINKEFLLKNFFDKGLLTSANLLFDDAGGSVSSLMVFLARTFGLHNFYLLDGSKPYSMLSPDASIIGESFPFTGDQSWIQSITGDFTGGFIGNDKFKVVFDINSLKVSENDLILYVCDEGNMKLDDFYLKNNSRLKIKNSYLSFLLEFNGDIKNKEGIEKELQKNSIDFSSYKNIYIYYPSQRWKSALPALIFTQYFG